MRRPPPPDPRHVLVDAPHPDPGALAAGGGGAEVRHDVPAGLADSPGPQPSSVGAGGDGAAGGQPRAPASGDRGRARRLRRGRTAEAPPRHRAGSTGAGAEASAPPAPSGGAAGGRTSGGGHRSEVGRSDEAGWSPRCAWLVAAATLVLAALLDAEALHDTATSQPFGWRHDVATALADPLVEMSRALHLTEPRHWLEEALDRPSTRPEPPRSTVPTTEPPPPPSTEAPTSETTEPTTATTEPARRTPTAEDPLRLLVAGDSMTEALGPVLEELVEGTGVVAAERALEYSSGLTRPDFFDWPAHLAELLDEHRPEVVVVSVGANDAQGIQTSSGSASFGTDAWVAEYRGRVAATMDLLAAEDRIVYWLGEPVMRSSTFDARMALITTVFRAEAERRPGIRFVDTRPTFAGDDGGYAAYLPDASGTPVLVRRDDGIHLTPAGAHRLATQLTGLLAEDWPLP